MARCLVIGCGCRGRALAGELIFQGHAVRGTTREPSNCKEIEAVGAEACVADPERVATMAWALEHVGLSYILLGSAVAKPEALATLHGPRLEMLLSRMLDTTVRAVIYEAAGSVDASLLGAGAARVRKFCEQSRIPYALLDSDPSDHRAWLAAAAGAAEEALAGR